MEEEREQLGTKWGSLQQRRPVYGAVRKPSRGSGGDYMWSKWSGGCKVGGFQLGYWLY